MKNIFGFPSMICGLKSFSFSIATSICPFSMQSLKSVRRSREFMFGSAECGIAVFDSRAKIMDASLCPLGEMNKTLLPDG